jgi:hypothetical protein
MKDTDFFAGDCSSVASSLVSISLELPDSLSDSDPESELESESDESEESDESSSTSSLVLVAALMAFFCVFAGSGEVDLLELLSLEEEEAAIVACGALRCARMKRAGSESERLWGSKRKVKEWVKCATNNQLQEK